MSTCRLSNRAAALLLMLASTTAWSQSTPARTALPPLPVEPGTATGPASLPATPATLLPHQGDLPNAPTSAASQRSTQLPTATIREFRSSVNEIAPRGATDMFIAALVHTRRFRVLERARLAEGAAAEKELNQLGMTTGQAGQSQYIASTFMFEATISEASSGDRKSMFTVGVAGAAAGRASQSDSLAIDVRVTDVESGIVIDAVTVRKKIQMVETKVGGITSALANILSKGRAGQASEILMPNDLYSQERKGSVDAALRDAIDEAVHEIVKRMALER
jgi:curli biogenesis system outer membrane secretion channel CsgG